MHLRNQNVKFERNLSYLVSDSQSWVYLSVTWKAVKNMYFQVSSLEIFTSRGLGNRFGMYIFIFQILFLSLLIFICACKSAQVYNWLLHFLCCYRKAAWKFELLITCFLDFAFINDYAVTIFLDIAYVFFFKWTKLDILHKYKPKPREVSGLLHGGVKLDLNLPTADAMHFHHLSFLHLAFVPFSLQPAPTHPIIICVSITCFTKPFLTHSLGRNLVSWMSSHISSSFFFFFTFDLIW